MFAERLAGIHAMAGAIDVPGNVVVDGVVADDRLEWNVAADPSAFVTVFNSGVPITLGPLDATGDVPMQASLIDLLADDESAAANLVYELIVRVPGRIGDGQQLWDELAALALSDPGLVTWEDADLVARESGRLDRDASGRPVRVAVAADQAKTETALLTSLSVAESHAPRRSS